MVRQNITKTQYLGRGLSALLTGTALTALGLLASAQPARAIGLTELPTGGHVTAGTATINNPAAGRLAIDQSSSRADYEWNTFNIGKLGSVTFTTPGAGALSGQ